MKARSIISWGGRALIVFAIGAMWLRSYCYNDSIWFTCGKPIDFTSAMGAVGITAWISIDPSHGLFSYAMGPDEYALFTANPNSKQFEWYWAGFGYYLNNSDGDDPRGWQRTALVPYWFLTLLAAQPLLWKFVGVHRRRRRARRGLCHTCGYDLRAHKSGERCPECGTAISPRPAGGEEQHGQDR